MNQPLSLSKAESARQICHPKPLHILNEIAVSILRAAYSETAVFEAFQEHLPQSGLSGAIYLLNNSRDRLIRRVVVISPSLHLDRQLRPEAGVDTDWCFPASNTNVLKTVIESGQPVYLPDEAGGMNWIFPQKREPERLSIAVKTAVPAPTVCAPLILNDRVEGLLMVTAAHLTSNDVAAVSLFAEQIALAIEKADLYRQNHLAVTARNQAEQTQHAVYRLSEAVHRSENLPDLFRLIQVVVSELMPAEGFFIALYDPDTGLVHFPHFVDAYDELVPKSPGRGLTAYILRTGEPQLITSELFAQLVASGEVEALGAPSIDWLGIPLKIGGQTIGVMAAQTYTPGVRLTEKDKDLLTFVSGQVAMAIQRKQAEDKIRYRNRELTLFNQIINASITNEEPNYILETVCRELAQLFDVEYAAAALLNSEKTLAMIVAENISEGQPSGLHQSMIVAETPSLRHLLATKSPLIAGDALNDPRLASMHPILRQRNIQALLILPLINNDDDNDVVGSLGLGYSRPRQFPAQEISFAWSVANQVSSSIAHARLAQTHQRMVTAIEQAAESVIITDLDGNILYVNSAFETITGYTQAEVIGKNPRMLSKGRHEVSFYQTLWATITRGETWCGRFINQKKDGSTYIEEASITPIRNRQNKITNYVSVQHDITDMVTLQEQYLQAQKMEVVGQLTAGIVHDFNNMLTVINGFAELMQMHLSSDNSLQSMVDKILHSGKRAADLTRQLLMFSRKQIIEPKVIDLNTVIKDAKKMLERIIGVDIEMSFQLAPDLWAVKADRAQIEQIILNLAVNACDAMPNGGSLEIKTANVALSEPQLPPQKVGTAGNYVVMTVTDTGVGMTEAVKSRIFEPFFTTKELGKGTGLGLATVFGIVNQCNGYIWVDSAPERGTTFEIYLPQTEAKMELADSLNQDTAAPFGTETVLLVEDESEARELIVVMLQRQGYTVLEAASPHEAVELAQQHLAEIDLLLTDVILPKMNGLNLADRLKAMRPELKTIFMSGYVDGKIMDHGLLDPRVNFIQKPFTFNTLVRRIREALDN